MFQSATFKLTGWYLLILMLISLVFSVTIYQITTNEISVRLERLQNNLLLIPGLTTPSDAVRNDETDAASSRIIAGLAYANLIILVSGGIGSFLLARRTLRPIQEAHEAQSRFTSDASHELRTPLAAMKAEIEVGLMDSKATKHDYQEILRSNLEEIEKLSRLSEMLLNLSRLEHDKLERSSVSLNDVTLDAIKRFGPSKSRIKVTASKHVMVYGSETALSELVSILLDNALKYSPSSSKVTIDITKRNRQASFVICNTGPGIDAQSLPQIFNRFYQADTSRNNHTEKGYGLGLALAKKIVELHNGELSVTSSPDVMTTFSVHLPTVQKITT